MKIFHEKQFLKRWWLLMFILAIILIIVGTGYYATRDAEELTAVIVSVICLAVAIPLVLTLGLLRLETRIDKEGVSVQFQPFKMTKKFFDWEHIDRIYVRDCNPAAEYGGWGIRGLGSNKKAYHIYGFRGIQIQTKNGDDFLIGTQRPESAQDIINLYTRQ